jgi:hypothetical protein
MLAANQGRGLVIEGVAWVANIEYAVTATDHLTLTLSRGNLKHVVGRPDLELRLPDGSRYAILLPSPPVKLTYTAILVKQLVPPQAVPHGAPPGLGATHLSAAGK